MAIKANDMDESDWIAVGIAIVLAFSVILLPFNMANLHNKQDHTIPDGALLAYIDCINRKDWNGASNLTIYSIDRPYSEWAGIIEDMYEDVRNININRIYQIEYYDGWIEAGVPFVIVKGLDELGIQYNQYCGVEIRETVYYYDKVSETHDHWIYFFIEMENNWYLINHGY